MTIPLYTIGFTKKTAEQFFTALQKAEVRTLLDLRLNNVSQLAGFTKRDDLRYFLKEICHARYLHLPQCAPTKEILDTYQHGGRDWEVYVADFLPLISERKIETLLTPDLLDHGCLLCSEPTPERCHRRLVAEYMKERLPDVRIAHL